MNDKIQVVIKRPNMDAEITEIENTLPCLQALVGGHIETVSFDDCTIVVNEEGLWENLPLNVKFRGHRLLGTVVLLGADDEGEFVSLDADYAAELAEELDAEAY